MRLEGRVALVTGAGTGIGQAICVGYAKEGADIAIAYSTSRAGAEETLAQVEALGRKGIIIQANIADPEQVKKMVDAAYEAFGRIDILVNNAAVRGNSLLLDCTVDVWDDCVNTNLRGSFLAMQAVAPIMIKQKYGKIINVCSILGYRPTMPTRAAYASTKSGLMSLTQSAAAELGPYGIYVNGFAPGTVAVGASLAAMSDEAKARLDSLNKYIPLRRRGDGEDMAGVALFLATDDSRYVNGACFLADGGWAEAE